MNQRSHVLFVAFLCLLLLGSTLILGLSLARGDSGALIVSDGKGYYTWARSVLLDHDIDFDNDYRLLYPPDPLPHEMEQRTPRGLLINKYPIGMAVLEAPGVLVGHAVALLAPEVAADGVSMPYQVGVVAFLLLLYLWSFHLLFRAMLNMGVAPFWATLSCIAMILGTNLLHYVAKEPAMAHAAGVAVFCILLFIVSSWPSDWQKVKSWQLVVIGMLVGLLVLLRNSNFFLFPFLVALLLKERSFSLKPMAILGVSAMAVFMLQPLALRALWGQFLLSGYTEEGLTSNLSGIVMTLFSPRHGLFIYHPWYLILLLTCIGALFHERSRALAIGALASFAILILMNGLWWCWWFGDSFGNRAFVEALPMLTVVAAMFLTQSNPNRRAAIAVVAAICLLNLYLWSGYLLQKYPHDGEHTLQEMFCWMCR